MPIRARVSDKVPLPLPTKPLVPVCDSEVVALTPP